MSKDAFFFIKNCFFFIQWKSESQFIEVDFSQPAFVTAAHFLPNIRQKAISSICNGARQ